MTHRIAVIVLLSLTLSKAFSQTITTSAISGSPFCAGATVNVPYTITGIFFGGNVFTAQLSSSTGSFASPVNIGTLVSVGAGTIVAQIPATQGTGAGYRIQVVSSSPAVTGTPNTTNLTINAIALNAPTFAGTTFCQGVGFNVTYSFPNGCAFQAGNVFTAQLSNSAGSFASPTNIGTVTATAAGTIPVTIPVGTPAGAGYRIQVVGSSPSVTSPNNGSNLTVNAIGLNAPTLAGTTFCQGVGFNVTYSFPSGCAFQSGNVFTAQLSNATGSFASPTTIGTVTATAAGTIAVTIPVGTPAGTAYRIQVVGSNPSVTSPSNASNLTINAIGLNAPTVAATSFCQGASFNVTYSFPSGCAFQAGNVFTAQLSNSSGSFASPTTIGSVTATAAGTIPVTIPVATPAGSGYLIQVVGSNPSVTSPSNTSNLTVNAIALNAPTFAGTTFCQGASFTLTYTFPNGCPFQAGNVFTAQLSDAFGSFSSPTTIGTSTATAAGNFTVTIPTSTAAGNAYRIRVVGSNPSVTSLDNGTNITINAFALSAPVLPTTSFCQGQAFSLTYTILSGCNFPNTPSSNVFTAQLSDASGNFTSPTTIGTITSNTSGTISASIPAGTPAGSGYLIRIVSSNPGTGVVGPNNGTNLAVTATTGTPTVFGSGFWNAYVYNSNNFTNYSGFYTENNLSFNTTTRFAAANAPSTANNASGSAYTGCSVNTAPWAISYKQTNFTCGYYAISIPSHDDNVTLLINGTQVYTATCCTANLNNVWTGFLGASTTVEFQIVNLGGPGNLQTTFSTVANPITVTPPVTICSTASTTLTASSSVPLSFAWTPTTGLTPSNGLGASVTAQPPSTTTYTVTGTDATTGCTQTQTVLVTVSATFTTAVSSSLPTICSGVNASTLTASGANTYTWSPATGLSATTGSVVTANPTSTTLYTVTGTNGCTSNNASTTVTVQTIPSSPATTTFGSGVWNAYCNDNTTLTDYYGYYTENNLSFNTTTRWGNNSGPTVANASSGLAYSGCSFGSTQYSISFKRTNFTCGYYQFDVNYQDDGFTLLVNGTQVFQNTVYTPTLQSNVWSGFLGPSTTVELQLINLNGPGQLQISIYPSSGSPQTLSPPVTICAGTNTGLTATAAAYPSATFSWAVSPTDPSISFVPNNTTSSPFFQTTASTPAGNYTVTNTMTDAGNTNCTANATVVVTVNPLPTTAVTPTAISTYCPSAGILLTASGANTYTWSPTTNLSAASGYQVTATPTATTTYMVTGSNNCSTNSASTTITVLPLPSTTTFPSGTWNVYGFNSTTIGTNYEGYYTENGSGASGYDFNTTTRWASGAAPSTANGTNGTAWQGCVMNATNISLSFKRTGFTCGVYQINILYHDDNFALLINGIQVGQHVGCCDTHTALWTGVLNSASTVEYQLVQFAGGSSLQVQFVPIAETASIWSGGVSADWATVGNWCTSVPTSTTDAIIFAAGPENMPAVGTTGAQVRTITINGAIAAGTYNDAIAAASLTTLSSFNLDVYGNWANSGSLSPNTGSISFQGNSSGNTISNSNPTAFYNVILNKTNPITNSAGIMQISNNLTFTSGILKQSASVNILNGATVSGASNSSYVDGLITKTGNSAFTFPVGNGGFYRPISISAPSLTTDNFTAQYFYSNPNSLYPNAQRAATLDHVSAAEYWYLNRSGGTSNVSVTLSWNTNSGGVGNLSSLRVARWDVTAAKWMDQGNGGTTGNTTAGTVISSSVVTTFSSPNSPFTLGTIDFSNPLPIELTDFTCSVQSPGVVKISWTTQSELNNDYFDVERSFDGESFTKITSVQGAGTTTQIHYYSTDDNNAPVGTIYYRLKQVDFDGTYTYSEVDKVDNPYATPVSVYPNPASNSFSINLNGLVLTSFSVIDMTGREIKIPTSVDPEKITANTTELVTGIYIVRIVLNGQLYRLKVLVEK